MTLYDTKEKLNKRWDELQRPEIDRLMKQANKRKGSMAQYVLYGKGIEGDFDASATGNEWGEERSRDGR